VASINFVAAHDGFTLTDLVSYNDKHNEANGEDNRDGHSHNLSANYGVEGSTDDPQIRAVRLVQMRNMLAILLLSRGTPNSAGPRAATTTPIARTTTSPGSTGRASARTAAAKPSSCASC
jgi:pullulanase/glycogen debranching enzyme